MNRSREYERALGWKNGAGDIGYDNWQLGYTAARRGFTVDAISRRPGTAWYAEKESRSDGGRAQEDAQVGFILNTRPHRK